MKKPTTLCVVSLVLSETKSQRLASFSKLPAKLCIRTRIGDKEVRRHIWIHEDGSVSTKQRGERA